MVERRKKMKEEGENKEGKTEKLKSAVTINFKLK
jgi:hypothetical protein